MILLPLYSWGVFSILDAILGRNEDNPDLTTPESGLFWYRLITLIWFPVQFGLLFGLIWDVPQAAHLGALEKIVLFFGIGSISGTIGINYSHESVSYTHLDVYKRQALTSSIVASSTTPRSARRQIVRHRCRCAARTDPPGRIKLRSGVSLAFITSISVSYTHLDVYKRQHRI